MDYLDEVKNLVVLHARAQGMSARRCRSTLASITTLDDGDGGWADAWVGAATAFAHEGKHRDAVQCLNLARFPFASTPGQKQAYKDCTVRFAAWAADVEGVEKLAARIDGTNVPVWFRGLPSDGPAPLLLVIGGIVSPKEQWADILVSARALGMAVVIVDFPGVGENSTRYTGASSMLISAVVDAVAARMMIDGVHALAMSFGGTVVLRAATTDPRIRSIVTVGAPVRYLFGAASLAGELPRTTVRTLEHLTGATGSDFESTLAQCALDDHELDRIKIPVLYIRSSRDEITPAAESQLLLDRLVCSRVVEFDDVHGSPTHMTAVRLLTIGALTRQSGRRPITGTALSILLSLGSRFPFLAPIDLGRTAA
ncbi:alpha/beta fold hydrolase [Rhodococcus sp. H29-C3]|uniref:alpha/beta hydrolase family protein n=1 Tax=Rhodococcus sp. H29-C3 TaxID=3046307 RepID=UPI0024BA9C48|nr:alpha/beta fold hydrolase [Rhodococcus sp. H29-C3]MDJ0360828.1 alpha/beta fold hydrolase [Rhodococcus sp. H29-C3]